MTSMRKQIIALGNELAEQDNDAFSLWTWLPSYKAAEAAHGDYAANHTPTVADVMKEAALFIAHGLNPTAEQRADAGDWYKCPCGELHDEAPQDDASPDANSEPEPGLNGSPAPTPDTPVEPR